LFQRGHYGLRRFILDELGVINLIGRIIHHHNQVVPSIILKSLMMTAVQVQQHGGQWPSGPTSTMTSALWRLLHQAGCLQASLHPVVAESNPMLRDQLLVEMLHISDVFARNGLQERRRMVEIEILVSVQRQHFVDD